MRLSEICVNRPVFAFMLIMFLVVLGVFSFIDLGVDLFPKSDAASVSIRLAMPGTSPEEMVSQIVFQVEEAIASVSGIDEMNAMVGEGNANMARKLGVTLKNLASPEVQKASDEEWRKAIVAGVGKMDPMPELSPADVVNVMAFMRSLKGK